MDGRVCRINVNDRGDAREKLNEEDGCAGLGWVGLDFCVGGMNGMDPRIGGGMCWSLSCGVIEILYIWWIGWMNETK